VKGNRWIKTAFKMLVKLTLGVIFTKLRLPSEKLVTGAQYLAKNCSSILPTKFVRRKKPPNLCAIRQTPFDTKSTEQKILAKKHWQKIWANICW
jgi:hypothetical protein